ncbi:MAG: 50S ribosomal protein L22 [Candidatus Taylorbacteria bacterium]|nr:50S ribosomal protein L22 [Candidatus Taylorbacteria bacterium]
MITASLKNYRQSPRKVRLVASLVKGKGVAEAISTLEYTAKRASKELLDLLKSAVANAKNNHSLDVNTLFIKDFRVDVGVTLKRMMPRARGSGSRINKRTSHITIVLAPKEVAEKNVDKKSKNK